MPYVTCTRCSVRTYVAAGGAAEPCPVCEAPLRPAPRDGVSPRDAELVPAQR